MNSGIEEFILELSSKSPVPGGGGASALVGAVGVSLCSMVASLTSGKRKYAEHQHEIDMILLKAAASIKKLLALIDEDAEVFEPLSAAYGIPRDDPNRAVILEKALTNACSVPMKTLREVSDALDIVERLSVIGTRLAISDIGVAASACRSAMESAVMNVYINTKLMKNRDYAQKINQETRTLLDDAVTRCNTIYERITHELRS